MAAYDPSNAQKYRKATFQFVSNPNATFTGIMTATLNLIRLELGGTAKQHSVHLFSSLNKNNNKCNFHLQQRRYIATTHSPTVRLISSIPRQVVWTRHTEQQREMERAHGPKPKGRYFHAEPEPDVA